MLFGDQPNLIEDDDEVIVDRLGLKSITDQSDIQVLKIFGSNYKQMSASVSQLSPMYRGVEFTPLNIDKIIDINFDDNRISKEFHNDYPKNKPKIMRARKL